MKQLWLLFPTTVKSFFYLFMCSSRQLRCIMVQMNLVTHNKTQSKFLNKTKQICWMWFCSAKAVTTGVRKEWDKGDIWSVRCSKFHWWTQTLPYCYYLQAYTSKILPTRANCSALYQIQEVSPTHSCFQHDLFNTFPLVILSLTKPANFYLSLRPFYMDEPSDL